MGEIRPQAVHLGFLASKILSQAEHSEIYYQVVAVIGCHYFTI